MRCDHDGVAHIIAGMGAKKTPQEKKQLSYDRDRRNVYGENDKSSRKNIPRRKQLAAQTYRTKTKQLLDGLVSGTDPDEAEARVRGVRSKGDGLRTAWRKSPDAPLRAWLERRKRG
jgi:hypothetical protein